MGCFDSIFFNCPNCGESIEEQSKSGACNLDRYHSGSVPVGIADSIDKNIIQCDKCKNYYEILSNAPGRVICSLKSSPTDIEGGWD